MTKDQIIANNFVIYFCKKSLLKDLFDEELGRLTWSSISQVWIRKYLNDRKMKSHHRISSQLHIEPECKK